MRSRVKPASRPGEPAVAARERILDAAVELFAETGYDGTPTARIAERAETPKGLLFHYFPTKRDVLRAVVEERSRIDELRLLPIDPVAGDVAQTLLRLADRFRSSTQLSPALRRIVFREAGTHPEVRHWLAELQAEALRRVRRAIDAALDGTRVRLPSQPQRDAAAAAFTSALLHDLHLHPLTGHDVDLHGIAALIAHGLDGPAWAVTG